MTLLQKEYNDVAYISGPLLFVNAASDLAYGAIVNIKDATGKTTLALYVLAASMVLGAAVTFLVTRRKV